MAAKESLPKIVIDVQETVHQLCQEFESNHEPITDDSTSLHRLCAKLEYLFTSSLKEKGVMAGKKSYWHWMYNCLHKTKGLQDGLKYVQANKEVRTSRGKGRALVRYCLVHQTLADSLQHCIMNGSLRSQHLNEKSILNNKEFASALVTSLYDLNAVNFDLNAKGYDLDSGWPTFASKTTSPNQDQWAIQSHVGSLGSLTSASIVMDTPRLHGSGSSAPSSVDQRIEELVLELDQSDNKIQDQQDLISQLEMRADSLERSTMEKEDILAGVISDIEAKNRHLHDAMSHMSSEFQAREHQWQEKTETLKKEKAALEGKNTGLFSKINQLEEDKRNLEELVSRNMSTITSGFMQNSDSSSARQSWIPSNHLSTEADGETNKKVLQENETLRKDLDKLRLRCAQLEESTKTASLTEAKIIEMQAALEDHEERTVVMLENAKAESAEFARNELIQHICNVLSIEEGTPFATGDKLNQLVKHLTSLHEKSKLASEVLQQNNETPTNSSIQEVISSLEDENKLLVQERDSSMEEVSKSNSKYSQLVLELENAKLQVESSRNKSSSVLRDLEEELSVKDDKIRMLQSQHAEMLLDLEEWQEKLKRSEQELQSTRARCKALEENLKQTESDWKGKMEEVKQLFDEEVSENEFTTTELQGEIDRQTALLATLDRDLQKEKEKSLNLRSDLEISKTSLKSTVDKFQVTEKSLKAAQEMLEENRQKLVTVQKDCEKAITAALIQQEEEKLTKSSIVSMCQQMEDCLLLISPEFKVEKSLSQDFKDVEIDEILKRVGKYVEEISSTSVHIKDLSISAQRESVLLIQQSQCDKRNLTDEMEAEKQFLQEKISENEKLKLKLDTQQEEKSHSLNLIERLQQENVDLKVALQCSKEAFDEAKLEVMEGSARELQLKDLIGRQKQDIESLSEKITELLRDKDTLWKESESLKNRTSELEESLDEVNWVHDDDATKCSMCAQQFSLTNRKHHCRMCGKIFCKSCSENWILRKNKRIRVCKQCVVNSGASKSLNVSMDASSDYGTPTSETNSTRSFDEITSSEVANTSKELNETVGSSSFYDSFTDFVSKTVGSPSPKESKEVKNEDTIKIGARKEIYLPILIEKEGITLTWNITSDLDIDFRLLYFENEGDAEQEVVPQRRLDSHVEPFVGQLVARQPGIYTIVLGNTFSRITSKEVRYKLQIIP